VKSIVSLTFDDGLRCQFERAVPVLNLAWSRKWLCGASTPEGVSIDGGDAAGQLQLHLLLLDSQPTLLTGWGNGTDRGCLYSSAVTIPLRRGSSQ
jgi:hypothetical protein